MRPHCYFYRSASPFSQWHPSKYVLDGVEFECAEKGMMHGKAKLFDDEDVANQILQASHPKEMKELGRKVKNFDQQVWKDNRQNIVYRNSVAKFTQNPILCEALLDAGEHEPGSVLMVEASPSDRIWGIGLNEKTARDTPPDQWKGQNLLGLILTQVRDEILRGELDAAELN